MTIEEFITYFADQFDDTDISEFKPETNFRELDEWSSLTALAVLNMISKKFSKQIEISEFKEIQTIQELYNAISK